MKTVQIALSTLVAVIACSCSSIDTPKGSSDGYRSARFVQRSATTAPQGLEDSEAVNKMVQDAIASEFAKNGIPMNRADADLIIAYMLIRQDASSTTMNADHFGYGRDPAAILERAHEKGVVKNKSPELFEAGAVLIDVLDATSNELVFRNFAKRSVIEGASGAERQRRIQAAVTEALAPFFK
jgi:hypothetical protein